MGEIVREFLQVVFSVFAEETTEVGSGVGVIVLCMIAFACIIFGVFIESRCALIYYVAPKGKKQLLGSLYIQNGKEGFFIRIPERFLEKSESIYYYMKIPAGFAHAHYMESLFVKLPAGQQRHGVKKQLHFKVGMR